MEGERKSSLVNVSLDDEESGSSSTVESETKVNNAINIPQNNKSKSKLKDEEEEVEDEGEEDEESSEDDSQSNLDHDPYLERFRVNFDHQSHGHDSQHHNYTVSIRNAKIVKKLNGKPSHVVYFLHSKYEPHSDSFNSPSLTSNASSPLGSSPSSSSNLGSDPSEVTYKISRRWEDFVWLREYLVDYFSTLEEAKEQEQTNKSQESVESSSPNSTQNIELKDSKGKAIVTEYHRHFGEVKEDMPPLPVLPAVTWKNWFGFGEFETETIEQRKRGLNKFMQQLSFHPVVGRHVLFKKFITEKSMTKVIEYFAL
eukprot:TRINITY_DN27974_c0_g1_i1.p1 TRINITY_DN27974_c0_g1~~TRINITY_DN27974_c0_g1_i1.p1  ORF type:complete len:312 (-),score=98.81 TRINITY_DN27974_c0_g1_i1:58-993(-)